MIWANLLHLGYNMWEDWKVPEPHRSHGRSARPYLRFHDTLWNDLTRQMADAGMNMVVIDLGEGVQYGSHPEIAVENAWSPERLQTELARLRGMGLEPIPKLNFSTAHDAWLGEYQRMVSTPKYYEVLHDLISEVTQLFDTPRFFHLGMDEETCGHQKFHQFVCVRQGDLWWHDFHFMVNEVEKAGSRPWIWSDFIWDHQEEFLQKMPKSVVQSNWYYNVAFENFSGERAERQKAIVDAYRKLEAHGFDQIPTGSNHSHDENMELTVDFCRKNIAPERLLGFMTAPWRRTVETSRDHHVAAIEQVARAIGSVK